MKDVTRGAAFAGQRADVEVGFRLHKPSCGRSIEAVGRVIPLEIGWELRLEVNGAPHRSAVYGTAEEVRETCERWIAAMIDNGWS